MKFLKGCFPRWSVEVHCPPYLVFVPTQVQLLPPGTHIPDADAHVIGRGGKDI